jgi:hypothetical protein
VLKSVLPPGPEPDTVENEDECQEAELEGAWILFVNPCLCIAVFACVCSWCRLGVELADPCSFVLLFF